MYISYPVPVPTSAIEDTLFNGTILSIGPPKSSVIIVCCLFKLIQLANGDLYSSPTCRTDWIPSDLCQEDKSRLCLSS